MNKIKQLTNGFSFLVQNICKAAIIASFATSAFHFLCWTLPIVMTGIREGYIVQLSQFETLNIGFFCLGIILFSIFIGKKIQDKNMKKDEQ